MNSGERIRKNNLILFILLFWLLVYMLFPGKFEIIKVVLLIFLILFSIIKSLKTKNIYRPRYALFSLNFILISLLYIFLSYYNGYEVDFSIIQIYILTPICVYFLTSLVRDEDSFYSFFKGLKTILTIIAIYDLLYILGSYGVIPQIIIWEKENVTILNESFLTSRLTNMNSLMFLYPMELTNFFLLDRYKKSKHTLLNIFLGGLVIVLSGRRALQIIVSASLFIILLLKANQFEVSLQKIIKFFIKSLFFVTIFLSIFSYLNNLLGLENILETTFKTLIDAFDKNASSSAIREKQTEILIYEWGNSPLFGKGLSAYVDYFIRSIETKWSYEHFYVALLYQTGIAGIFFYFAYIIGILKSIYKNYKFSINNQMKTAYFAIFFGFICYLVTSATNPMLTSMWPWVIVIIAGNKFLYRTENEKLI